MCFRPEHKLKATSLLSGLRGKTPLFGGKQPAEVALSRRRNCPSALLPGASGIRGEPRFLGCNRTLRRALFGLVSGKADSGNSVAGKGRLQPAACLRRRAFSAMSRKQRFGLQHAFSRGARLPALHSGPFSILIESSRCFSPPYLEGRVQHLRKIQKRTPSRNSLQDVQNRAGRCAFGENTS